jgi:hypothetical protein
MVKININIILVMKRIYIILIILVLSSIVSLLCIKTDVLSVLYSKTTEYGSRVKNDCSDIDIYYNETQIRDIALERVLSKLSSKNKITLNGSCEKKTFTIATIDQQFKKQMDVIVNLILERIADTSNFKFRRTEYEGVTVITERNTGRKGYIIDVYVEDLTQGRSSYDQRLLIDVVTVKTLSESTWKRISSQLPSYSTKYPEEDQIIPGPMEVISTGGNEILGSEDVKVWNPETYSMLYVNDVRILNSNLVLSYLNTNKVGCLGGVTDNTLDYTGYCGSNDPIQEKSVNYNKWIDVEGMPEGKKQFPEHLVKSFCWDNLGLFPETSNKNGVRSSVKEMPLQPNYWKSTLNIPYFQGPNFWLFNPARGLPSFMDGTRG